jgi:hypothetical protein
MVALSRRAAEHRQRLRQFGRLYALGGRLHAQRLGKAQHRAHDRHGVAIGQHAGDEAAIDLEHVDRQFLKVGER